MSASTIRNALGLLQDDPDNERAYQELREAVGSGEAVEGMSREEVARLLEAARRAHEMRREYDAVASLLELEVAQSEGTPAEVPLLTELARVTEQELFDDARAGAVYKRILEHHPDHEETQEALEKAEAKQSKWADLVKRYVDEAETATEPGFKGSLLVSAAEFAYRFGRASLAAEKGSKKKVAALMGEIISRLDEALRMDPRNRRAANLLEHIHRENKRWEELATVLETLSTEATAKEEKTAGFVRLARVLTKKIGSPERAVAAYERVLDLSPGHPEAVGFLVDFFTHKEMWDHLVSLYEGQLSAATRAGREDLGTVVQIAMTNWRMRNKPEAAEPYFERLRKYEPSHQGMITFFREFLSARGETARLVQILTDAQRAMPDGPARAQVGAEIAKLAEDGANATKAIEQWRGILRQDANNKDAREALKRLYRQSANYPGLADLLRGELEKLPQDDAALRLPVLREIAGLYQTHIKNDAALVSVLSQVMALDAQDADAARELARIYEALGRFRDLLTTQARLAELEQDPPTRSELYRQIARRWLDQFSNVQNAVEAYEKLLLGAPTDQEASTKLKELYAKRRSYKPLYDLYEKEAAALTGEARREKWIEMAKLAAERLDRGADAVRLYKLVLEEDPGAAAALDALEKQAERDKDFVTVAEVLERRIKATEDTNSKLTLLQKLGAIYTDRLQSHDDALRTWRRVLDLQPGQPKALRVLRDSYLATADYDGLGELYASGEDWEGLAEVLSSAADKTTDATAKIELSFRAADVYAKLIKAPERAFRAYERVLGIKPDDKRAASALAPLYEADEKWPRLPALYEVLLGHAETDEEKLGWLAKLSHVTGKNLQDRAAAFRYSRRAYEVAPTQAGALEKFERAAIDSGEWVSFTQVLTERLAQKKLDSQEKRLIQAKMAETYATQLGRIDEAVAAYKSLVEEDIHDELAVSTLDRILRSADRRDDLRWLFEQRILASKTARKLELLEEWATLEEEALGAPAEAAKLYRRILEIVPQHGRALRSLSRLLQGTGDSEEAATLLERDRDQREGKERASREVELAKLYAGSLKRAQDALAAIKRALELSPHDAGAVAVLEDLLARPETRAKAAELLEQHYAETGNPTRQAEIILVLIATTAAKEDRMALYVKLAGIHEGLGDGGAAFDVLVRATSEFPSQISVWDKLSELAQKTQRTQAFAESLVRAVPLEGPSGLPQAVEVDLAERVAAIYDEMGDVDHARPYLDRVLVLDPKNERAFGRLKQILTSLERWDELEAMYERAVASGDGPRQTELLGEVALVAEEITGDKAKAIQYYERILSIDPAHEQSTRSLDSLYSNEGRFADLAKLLEKRILSSVGGESLALRGRLGTLLEEKLGDHGRALDQLAAVLESEPGSDEARALVERVLPLPEHRARAAAILEAVYLANDSARDLVRVLEVRMETASAVEDRAELLRRIAELRDDRLNEDVAALDTYARLVPIAPDDSHARARLLDIARRVGSHAQAAEVLTASAKAAKAPQPRADILMEVAKIHEDFLGDATKAEGVYREVLQLEPDDAALALPAVRALERIYAAAGKSADLAEALRLHVKLEDDVAVRRELQGRLGELCESSLDDPKGAIAAWKARVEDDPSDEVALASLDRLYERTGDFKALVEVLRSRERAATDKDTRKKLMVRLGQNLADKLSDVTEAILAYRAVIDEFGAESSLLSALATLYEVADRYDDLAETLEAELGMSEETSDRLALLAKLGDVRRSRLKDLPAALETYRQALTLEPSHAPSRAALEEFLADDSAKRDAAAILRPLYEADGEQAKLLRVLDIEVEFGDTVDERLGVLAQAVVVAEQSLQDVGRAFGYAARALREAAGDSELRPWMERAERLSVAAGKHAEFVELLRAVAPDVLDESMQLEVLIKVAELGRDKLADPKLAREYYEKALQIRADERRALEALEALYRNAQDWTALNGVLKRRAESADTDAERKEFLFKDAKLADETMDDPKSAIEVYEQIMEIGSDNAAFDALERLYAKTERFDDLVALYERRLGADIDDDLKALTHQKLGSVYHERLNDTDRAFDSYEAALKIEAQHGETVASLEKLMADPTHAARAAEMLESVYLARLDWRRVMESLQARLASSQDPDERRTLLKRLAKLHEEQEENYAAAVEVSAKLLAEDVTDEDTWAELERLARVANARGRLAEIFATELERVTSDEPATAKLAARTGELFEEQKNIDRALVFYRRAHAFAPEEAHSSFEAIDRLLRETSQHAERVKLYRDALELNNEPSERLTTLHTIAALEESDLHDDDAAIETYRAALDTDDSDPHSLEALARLYARRERWRDLADLTRRRAEQSALPEDEARFRYDLGQLLHKRLSDAGGAIDEYQMVVETMPPGSGNQASALAVKALEELLHETEHKARVVELLRPIYERSDDWQQLVTVNDERLGLTSDTQEKVSILKETGRLWEERGGNRERAFDAFRAAFELDPDDGDARSQLDMLAAATQRWDDVATAYEKGIERAQDSTKRELLIALAVLHDQKRDDPRRALQAYGRVFLLDETDIEPLVQMDSLATLLSDWTALVRVLAKKAELQNDDSERADTWRRIGEARRDMLEDSAGAIEAYERALELEADSAPTIDNLIPLYAAKNDAARLVDLYRRRVELCGADDQELKYRLLVDAADRYEKGLNDRREAITLLGEALSVKPQADDVTARLDVLYTAEKMWPELLDNLKLQAAAATDEKRREFKKRVGALLQTELEDPRGALDAYRDVLDAGFDADAAKAIREIGDTREELRLDAADALEPVLRATSKNAELADVLEMRLRAQTEPTDRARTLRAIAQVTESSLGDSKRAQAALIRALVEEPEDAELHGEIVRLADRLGTEGYQTYADALAERAGTIFDANLTTDLFVRLGRVEEVHLHNDVRAAKAYAKAAEQIGDTTPTLLALDGLYSRMGDTKSLADVLERRIAIEGTATLQADLYHRLAVLQIKEFGEKSQGLGTLRSALEKVPDHGPSGEAALALLDDDALFADAFDVLEGMYRSLGKSEELAKLFERRVARASGPREKIRARLDLARVIEDHVKDAPRAQRTVESALALDPTDVDAMTELERLAPVTGGWKEAADALAQALGAQGDDIPTATRAELWMRLGGWRRDKLSDSHGAEEAFLEAKKADPESLDVLRAIEDLQRAPGRERALVATLRARAKLDGDPDAKRMLLKEAKNLAEGNLADPVLAETVVRDLLSDDEGDLWALEELTRMRESANAWEEVAKLLQKRVEVEADGRVVGELRHRAADVFKSKLHEPKRAIALYKELLDADPGDVVAQNALRELYSQTGNNKELARLLESLIDAADSAGARATLRIDLAKLQDAEGEVREAINTLRAVIDEDASHQDAVVTLSALLEKSGQDDELAELLTSQIEQARGRGDGATEMMLQVRLGDVYESRLKDTPRALATYEGVLERDGNHRAALEAVARLSESRANWERASSALAKLVDMATDATGVPLAMRLAAARSELKDDPGVEQALRRALELETTNSDVRDRLRTLYEKGQKWAELAELLVQDADLAEDAAGTEKTPAAIAAIVKSLRRAADIHTTHRKSFGDAVPPLERASALLPADRELLLLLCDAYTASGREKSAAEALEKVIASFAGKRTKELAVYHHRLGRALSSLGDQPGALAQFDLAQKIDPGSIVVLRDLGIFALESGDLDRAQKTFRALLLQKLDDKSGISKGEVFHYLGEILLKQNDKPKALQMFERALENDASLSKSRARISELKG